MAVKQDVCQVGKPFGIKGFKGVVTKCGKRGDGVWQEVEEGLGSQRSGVAFSTHRRLASRASLRGSGSSSLGTR